MLDRKIFNSSAETKLTEYNGNTVKVIRPLTAADAWDEEVGPMFLVEFHDGTQDHVFGDELSEPDEVSELVEQIRNQEGDYLEALEALEELARK